MEPTIQPYQDYEYNWPEKMIQRLRSHFAEHERIHTSPQYVAMVIHEQIGLSRDPPFQVVGIFKSMYVANRLAMHFFKHRYDDFLYHDPGNMFHNIQEMEEYNKVVLGIDDVGWFISDAGELSLKLVRGVHRSERSVYVERRVLFGSYEQSVTEVEAEFKPD
ncbi:hypothetical protein N7456_012470 [Penicillium angulare]|uniref:Uncharacterized protein n=1 Tax=Penicillium angulare TaxID=116970 RepID=A0A9W9EVU6_9EURO|nr:hypothetical protein N7456_012470 [Penicillium angulare]